MRLGEKKNIVKKILNDQKQIVPATRNELGGQIIYLDNWRALSQALQMLLKEKWIIYDADKSDKLKDFIKENKESDKLKFSDQAEDSIKMDFYNLIKVFIDYINPTMPLWYDIFDSMEEEQDEQVINIKFNKDAITFDELVAINQRWIGALKLLDLHSKSDECPTIKFDKGSNWYSLGIKAYVIYRIIIGCLHIYQEVQISLQEFYKTKDYELSYLMEKAKVEAENKELIEEKFKRERYEFAVNSKIDEIIKLLFKEEEIKEETKEETKTEIKEDVQKATKGRTQGELRNRFKDFYDFLEKEIETHKSEIHPSLNPPKYINEEKGIVKIDVDKMKAIYKEKQESIEATKPEQVESEPSIEENK